MSPRWLIAFAILFAVFTVFSNIVEMNDPYVAADQTVLSRLLSFQHISAQDPIGAVIAGVNALSKTVGAIWDILWFNYSFLVATPSDPNFIGTTLRILLLCVSVGFMLTLALTLIGARTGGS